MIRNMKKCFMLVVLVFVMVAAGEVWEIRAASAAPATPAKPISMAMMVQAEPSGGRSMGTFGGTQTPSWPIIFNVMQPLIALRSKGEPVPVLATKWEQRGPTTWRVHLRKGVKFHNGADFTALDVVEFVKWNVELGVMSPYSKFMPFEKAVALDDYTVDLIFRAPHPLFLVNVERFLIPPVAISRGNREMYEKQPIGTGPYRFVEWKRGQEIRLSKFEGYWGPKPQIDEVRVIFRGEEGVRVAALMAGEVQLIEALSPENTRSVPQFKRVTGPGIYLLKLDEYIQKEQHGVDCILADKRLRLALDYAIDRELLANKLFSGFASPAQGQMGKPGDFGFNSDLKGRPYDLEKAKVLVKEAGAIGKTLSFVSAAGAAPKDREMAEAIAAMIEQTGLKVKLRIMDYSEYNKYKRTFGDNRPFKSDILLAYTSAILETESRYIDYILPTGGDSFTNDPETVRLWGPTNAEVDFAKRGEKLAKAWKYVYEDAHYIPLLKPHLIWGVAKNLEWDLGRAVVPWERVSDMRFTD